MLTKQTSNDILKMPNKVNIKVFLERYVLFFIFDKNTGSIARTFSKICDNFVWRQMESCVFLRSLCCAFFYVLYGKQQKRYVKQSHFTYRFSE